jgi:hypothetical protein
MEPSTRALLPPALYVNVLRIAHRPTEFFLSFAQTVQDRPGEAHLVASLVTSPVHAKAMLAVLAQAVQRHEECFGEVRVPAPGEAPSIPAASGEPGERAAPPAERPGRLRPRRA